MSNTIDIKANGLSTSRNHLQDSGTGGLNVAKNVIIQREGIVEPRRGFKLYGTSFGTSTDVAKQLISYKDRLIRHFNSVLQWDTLIENSSGESIFDTFSGSFTETEPGLRIKSVESNGNLYFTTSEGIKKISATSADDFTTDIGYITNAGGIKAIDFTATANYEYGLQSGFLPIDSVVSYRVVWGTRDLNNNLILGSPSERIDVYNEFLPILIADTNHLLIALDNIDQSGSLINDGDYFSTLGLIESDSATTLRSNLLSLATKLDNDILLADTATAPLVMAAGAATTPDGAGTTRIRITFTSGDPTTYISIGDSIILAGFTMTAGNINATHIVTNVQSTYIEFINGTVATGPSTVAGTIYSYNYRAITQPGAPSLTPTHQQLLDLQTYLSSIIQRLQSELDGVVDTALSEQYLQPLDVTSSATVRLVINIPDEVSINDFVQVYRTEVLSATGTDVLSDLLPGEDGFRLAYEAYPTTAELSAGEMIITDVVFDTFLGAFLYTNENTGEGILQANEPPPLAKDLARFKNSVFYANTKTREGLLLSLLGVTNFYTSKSATSITFSSTEATITSAAHGFVNGDEIVITNSNSVPSIDGAWTISGVATNTFNITIATGATATPTAGTSALLYKNLNPQLLIGSSSETDVYTFTLGSRDNSSIEVVDGSNYATSGTADYFTISAAQDVRTYYVWFYVNGGTMTDPSISGQTGIRVVINAGDTADQVAGKVRDSLNSYDYDFFATTVTDSATDIIYVITENVGYTTAIDATSVPVGFTVTTLAPGQGENSATKEVLLSTDVSPATAVFETSKSLVHVVNTNALSEVYLFYISGPTDAPGKLNIQAKTLSDPQFFILINGNGSDLSAFGNSFSPAINPTNQITNIATGNPTTVTSVAHGLVDNDTVIIVGSDSTPSIDGVYTVTGSTANTFDLPVNVTIAGTNGYFIKSTNSLTIKSSNEERVNRVYYSKLSQPEAVPLLNYFDVGAESRAILRIIALRDSLFVFKEDGVYRISGESIPFSLALFDSSCLITAPDSVSISNNYIYGWSTQGIIAVSEAGVSSPPISRAIDNIILPIRMPNYPNFKTATWGIGYDSDNSYIVFTTNEQDDTVATIAYRYSTITGTWTTFDKTNTCGVINRIDDTFYTGAGDTNFLEKERKTFTRLDYADREFDVTIPEMTTPYVITLPSVSDFSAGDVLVQDQLLTIYQFNGLLDKLDIDLSINDSDYRSLLEAEAGDNLRFKLEDLSAKLDSDLGVSDTDYLALIETKSGTITGISLTDPTVLTLNNKTFVAGDVNTGTDTITIVAHGFTNNQQVTFTTSGTLPGGLSLSSIYYIINSSANDFQLSLTSGGSALNLTSGGTGTHHIWKTHELQNNRIVNISGSNSFPSIDGTRQITTINLYQFSVDVAVTTEGTAGTFTTADNDFRDIEACYNAIINKLNNDAGVYFSNYMGITTETIQEAIIINVNIFTNRITLNLALPFIFGEAMIYKAYETDITYEPNHLGNPLFLKHAYEATLMLDVDNFTTATIGFASDLLPAFVNIPITGQGNGIFGHQNFGTQGFFGGIANAQPIRTLVPRNCQRCRYLLMRFQHNIARETFSLMGITITANPVGIRTNR